MVPIEQKDATSHFRFPHAVEATGSGSQKGRSAHFIEGPSTLGAPIVVDRAAGAVAAKPGREVFHLIAIGNSRRCC
jgi:hypothetical protein